MTDPISFDAYTGWVDVTDPNNLPPDLRIIGAADLLRYENLGLDIAEWTEQWANADPGAVDEVDGNTTLFRPRRWDAAQWTTVNPVLVNGEMALESDTARIKFGDGITAWTDLPYVSGHVLSVAGRTGVIVLVKDDVGLDQVDNTADVDKPVSTAQQEALDEKVSLVGTDDIEISHSIKGLILKSPNGTRYRLGVDDEGALTTTSL